MYPSGAQAVRVVGDPNEDLFQLVWRLSDRDERPEDHPHPAVGDESAAGGHHAVPRRIGLEDRRKLRLVERCGAHRGERPLLVALLELVRLAGLEQLKPEGAVWGCARIQLPGDRRCVLDPDSRAPSRCRDLERVDGEDDLLAGWSVRLAPLEIGLLGTGGDARHGGILAGAKPRRVPSQREARKGGAEGDEDDDRRSVHVGHARTRSCRPPRATGRIDSPALWTFTSTRGKSSFAATGSRLRRDGWRRPRPRHAPPPKSSVSLSS